MITTITSNDKNEKILTTSINDKIEKISVGDVVVVDLLCLYTAEIIEINNEFVKTKNYWDGQEVSHSLKKIGEGNRIVRIVKNDKVKNMFKNGILEKFLFSDYETNLLIILYTGLKELKRKSYTHFLPASKPGGIYG